MSINELLQRNYYNLFCHSISADIQNIDNIVANSITTVNLNAGGNAYPVGNGNPGQVLATNGSGILSFADSSAPLTAIITTNDNVLTTIPSLTITTTNDTAYYIETKFLAREISPGINVGSFNLKSTFNNVSGLLDFIGVDVISSPPGTLLEVNVVSDMLDIKFMVKGLIATTINWKVEVNIIVLS